MAMPRSFITLAKLPLNFRAAERSIPHQISASEKAVLPIDHDGGDYAEKEEKSIMIDDLESMADSDAGGSQSIMIDDLDNVKEEESGEKFDDTPGAGEEKIDDDEIRLDLQYVDEEGKLTLECFYPAVELPKYPVTAAQIGAVQLHHVRLLALGAVNVALTRARDKRESEEKYVEVRYHGRAALLPVRDRQDVRNVFADMMAVLGFGADFSHVGNVKIFW